MANFKLGDKVKVIKGFYENCEGVLNEEVFAPKNIRYYRVGRIKVCNEMLAKDFSALIKEPYLEKIN